MAFNQTKTTNASGIASFAEVPVGTGYTLQTISGVPDGYDGFSTSSFDVTTGMPVTAIALQPQTDNDLSLGVTVLNEIGGTPVQGAKFEVYADSGHTMLLGEFESDVSGEFLVPHLVGVTSPGRAYYVLQTEAPSGFSAASEQTVLVITATAPSPLIIVNPPLVDLEVKVSDTNYSNIIFANVDVEIDKA